MPFWRHLLLLASTGSVWAGCSCGDKAGAGNGGFDGGFDGGGQEDFPSSIDAGPIWSDGGPPQDAGDGGPGRDGSEGCGGEICAPDQHCQDSDGSVRCLYLRCSDITCGAGEQCKEGQPGTSGATCVDCISQVDCTPDQYCSDNVCKDDSCPASARRCEGGVVYACALDGSEESAVFTCVGGPTADNQCIDDGFGTAGCRCRDDWDCPAGIFCEAGLCVGRTPACVLSVETLGGVSPQLELAWGGVDIEHPEAVASPFPAFAQAVMTPVVANLNDDNSDGLINELDFPEIIFVAYESDDPGSPAEAEDVLRRNGVLRAIHGGGPDKGEDFFAACGDTTWHKGDSLTVTCASDQPTLNATAAVAVGDLDDDGVPEIVAIKEDPHRSTSPQVFGIEIFNNSGDSILRSEDLCTPESSYRPCITYPYPAWERIYPNAAPAIANLDNQGPAEIIVGRFVFTLQEQDPDLQFKDGDIQIKDVFEGRYANGSNVFGPVSCVADLAPDPQGPSGEKGLEVAAGTSVYRLPQDGAGYGSQQHPGCDSPNPLSRNYCMGKLDLVWDAYETDPDLFGANSDDRRRRGFCAVADVWGADTGSRPGPDNPLDGKPELITISDGWIQIFTAETGTLIYRDEIWPKPELSATWESYRGGPPNVDDFDGDGYPEIGSAFSHAYTVVDLQAPSDQCPEWDYIEESPYWPDGGVFAADQDGGVPSNQPRASDCLHNGWRRYTRDRSRATGSSVFDLNGDGAAEVIYNDECNFRIYDGRTGKEIFRQPSISRTRIEYPVVADVDNDGNAEIVFTSSNALYACSGESLDTNNGLEVWGDSNDLWVQARRIWNQHAYHITNVFEDGRIAQIEPDSWLAYNGHYYNTYRSDRRTSLAAPDLLIASIQLFSPDQPCDQLSEKVGIAVRVQNAGDIRVGPGVGVLFSAKWGSGAWQTLDSLDLRSSVEPGGGGWVTAFYDADNDDGHDGLPDRIQVQVDEADGERECDEENNLAEVMVDPGTELADLRVEVGRLDPENSCALPVRVYNDGSAPASNVVVRFYAGDPAQGGRAYYEEVIEGPIAAGGNAGTSGNDHSAFPPNRVIRVFVVADPYNVVMECNDANNTASATQTAVCP